MKIWTWIIKCKYCECFLEYTNLKYCLIKYTCLCCNKKIIKKKFVEKLKERVFKQYKFSNHNNNKFILLLQKGSYPYEYMDDWGKFNETFLPKKDELYSYLDMEDITDAGYMDEKSL